MPKVPHGRGLDARQSALEWLRRKGFGHFAIRAGHTSHGGVSVTTPGPWPDWDRRRHGWAEGFPIGTPVGTGLAGQWDFSNSAQSGHLLTAGL